MQTRQCVLNLVLWCQLPLLAACADARTQPLDASVGGADGSVLLDDGGNPLVDAAGPDCSSPLTGWHPLGGPMSASGIVGTSANAPDITVDPVTGLIYVAWTEGDPTDGHVRAWDGASWSAVGGPISLNPDNSPVYSVELAARDGALVLAHAEAGGDTGTGFYVQSHEGGWQLLGGGDLSTDSVNVSGGALEFDDQGDVVVAWSQYTVGEIGRNRIHVRRFTGPAYVPLGPELGGVAGPGASALTPSVSFASDGAEIVAFSESGVRVFERDAADAGWETLGDDNISALMGGVLGAHSPHLARGASGDIYLAIAEYDQATTTSNGYLLRLVGSAWQVQSGVADIVPGEHSYVRALTVDGEGRPVVAITEGDPVSQLYMMRHNGSGFADVGTLPLSAYGGTDTIGAADLTTDTCGRVVVAFSESESGGDRNLHVYRFYE